MRQRSARIAILIVLASAPSGPVCAVQRNVSTTDQFIAALAAAGPGDEIVLAPGTYNGGRYRANLRQVTIRSANPATPAVINGGSNGIQLSDATDVTLADLVFQNQTGNGINIDDGGSFATPTTGITLRNLVVRDIVTAGNHDGIKLSGVTGFRIENVRVENWGTGGSAVDMVGCHHGLIQNSYFKHTNSANGGTTLQPKGGSKDITFRANRIELPANAGRAVQAGGSTGTPYFRFIDGDSGYEARGIVAEGNVISGGSSAFSWVNIDGGIFHHNIVETPQTWVTRILNENQGAAIVDTRNGKLHDNRIIFDTDAGFRTAVNVGAETEPQTFQFARNHWVNRADETPAGSTPSLPTQEVDGVYGGDSTAITDVAHVWDFAWGKWIVNANATAKSVEVSNYQQLRRAVPGTAAEFNPLRADPLAGAWSSAPIPAAVIQLPAFSQMILIDPASCTNCLSMAGDYDGNGTVDQLDYGVWRRAFGTATLAADGNGDGVVNAADYVVWRNAMGAAGGGAGDVGVFAAPGPTTALGVIGASAIAAMRPIRIKPRNATAARAFAQ